MVRDIDMTCTHPPYRLETCQDVRSCLPPKPNDAEKRLLHFAMRHKIIKPPILSAISDEYELEIMELKKSVHKVVQEVDLISSLGDNIRLMELLAQDYINSVADVEESVFDTYRSIIRDGRGLLSGKKSRERFKLCEEMSPVSYPLSARIHDQIECNDMLVTLLRNYLHTRKEVIREFIRKSILKIVAYDTETSILDAHRINRLLDLNPTSSIVLNDLHVLLCERIARIERNMFAPHCFYLKKVAKERIMKLGTTANVKRNFFDLFDRISDKQSKKLMEKKLYALLKSFRKTAVDANILQKIQGIVDNFFEKTKIVENFFKDTFFQDRVEKLYRMFCQGLQTEKVTIESISTKTTLKLYPCKDYHDYLKGIYSSDCSLSMASEHLLHPRFFNIRVFKGVDWIGCIYMIDYSEDKNTVVMDRIQIKDSANLMPIDFFATFIEQLTNLLSVREGLRIIAPSLISNFKFIQFSYDEYCRGRQKVLFSFSSEDKSFECSRRRYFYLLSDQNQSGAATLNSLIQENQ